MLDRFKQFWQGVMLAPFINLFIRLGVSPDAVTLAPALQSAHVAEREAMLTSRV